MKKFLFLILLLSCSVKAQDVRFTASIYAEPQHYSTQLYKKADGFNIGAQIEYQMTLTYFDAEVFFFPDLNGIDYFHAQATLLGFNFHDRYKKTRVYLGLIKIGVATRNFDGPHPMVGVDLGIEQYFGDFYVGLQTGWDYRTDNKYYSNADKGFIRNNSGIRLGYVFNQAPKSLWRGCFK
jgi:hypothetical protein